MVMPISFFLHLLGTSKYGFVGRDQGGLFKSEFDKCSFYPGVWEVIQEGSFRIYLSCIWKLPHIK